MAGVGNTQPLLREAPPWWLKPSRHCPAIPPLENRSEPTGHRPGTCDLLFLASLEEKKAYREPLLRVTGTLWFPSAGTNADDIYRRGNYI